MPRTTLRPAVVQRLTGVAGVQREPEGELAATGITNKSLRALMTGLLTSPYTPGQMTYDLRRLRLTGLIRRVEHTNRYVLTSDGVHVAIFYTNSTTGCYGRSSPPTNPRHHPNSEPPSRPSTSSRRLHQPCQTAPSRAKT